MYLRGLLWWTAHYNSVFPCILKTGVRPNFKTNGLRKLFDRGDSKAAYLTSRLWHRSRSPHLSRFTVRTGRKWPREMWEVSFGEERSDGVEGRADWEQTVAVKGI